MLVDQKVCGGETHNMDVLSGLNACCTHVYEFRFTAILRDNLITNSHVIDTMYARGQ